ncbi:hypothetical protein [Streptomyces sp. NPDC059176]
MTLAVVDRVEVRWPITAGAEGLVVLPSGHSAVCFSLDQRAEGPGGE